MKTLQRFVGWHDVHHLHFPMIDRPDRGFWLDPNDLVRLAEDCAKTRQSR